MSKCSRLWHNMNFEHIMFTNHIVLKPGTLDVCKQNTFRCSINFQCSNLGHFFAVYVWMSSNWVQTIILTWYNIINYGLWFLTEFPNLLLYFCEFYHTMLGKLESEGVVHLNRFYQSRRRQSRGILLPLMCNVYSLYWCKCGRVDSHPYKSKRRTAWFLSDKTLWNEGLLLLWSQLSTYFLLNFSYTCSFLSENFTLEKVLSWVELVHSIFHSFTFREYDSRCFQQISPVKFWRKVTCSLILGGNF